MKIVIILLMSFVSYTCYACKVLLDDPVYSNPENAKTILMVELDKELDDSTIVLKTVWPWDSFKFRGRSEECLGFSVDKGKRYLFYTSLRDKDILQNRVERRNSRMIEVSDPQLMSETIEWLTKNEELPSKYPNVFWSYCQKDLDCIKAKDSCGNFIGVNKEYQSNYSNYLKKKKYPQKCSSQQTSILVSRCIENFCS